MTRRTPITTVNIPLFADDYELGEVVLGWDRRRQFKGLAQLHERSGMPEFSQVWAGRYAPAVFAFLAKEYGWDHKNGFAGGDPGTPGDFGEPNALRSSREWEAYYKDPRNARTKYRKGKVRVRGADGMTWIEDAKPTDPKSWQADYVPEPAPPKNKKRKLMPRLESNG